MISNSIYVYRQKMAAGAVKLGRENKYRQRDLAEYAGMPRSKFSMIETGRMLPTMLELERISEYLEVTPGHLYSKSVLGVVAELEA